MIIFTEGLEIVLNHPMSHVSINLQGQKYCSICPLCHRCEGTSAGSHVNAAAVSKAPYAATHK